MKTIEQQREEWRLKRRAKLATMTPEQRKELFAKNSARRTAKRAAKALVEGRIPGKAGQPPRLTPEERKASDKASYARYREKNIERIRKRDAEIKRKERAIPEGALCDLPMEEKGFHVDHWKPLSKGGSNDKSNLKLLHPRCNLSKGAKLPTEINLRSA